LIGKARCSPYSSTNDTQRTSRSQAWSWASRGAAETLGLGDSGKIEMGARADLLTSPASPLEPGWRPLQVSSVVAGGKLVLTQDLDAAISSELARFEGVFSRHVSRWLAQFTLNRIAKNFVN
jgi:cytosine/adenosine deaminase-related metal-dependent hydrolase